MKDIREQAQCCQLAIKMLRTGMFEVQHGLAAAKQHSAGSLRIGFTFLRTDPL